MKLLDTNIWIAIAKNEHAVVARFKALDVASVGTCPVVRSELEYGARKSQKVDFNLSIFDRLLAPFDSLPFDDTAACHYGFIRAQLEAIGRPIGPNDLLVASIALAHDATLVTRNSREFQRVPGLRLEPWD